jgi:hypothetical protein
MNDAELELYIYRILSGTILFYIKGEKYELKPPSPYLRYESNLIYNNIINDEKYSEWIREENLINVLINIGLWDKDTQKLIQQLDKTLENQKVELYQTILMPNKHKLVRNSLESTKKQLNKLSSIKNEFFINTLEGYASSIKNEYIVCKTLYKNNKLVFDSTIVNNQSSYTYFNDIISEINKYIIDISQFKTIARSSLWRSYWNSNKKNIFKGSVSEWTDDQRTLSSISNMYDSVYEHPECPEDKIIEDDDMLDGWMIIQRRKAEKHKKENKIDNLNPNLKNAQEIFLMTNENQTFDDIMSLNSPESKLRFKEKISYINNSKGQSVPDHQLPDVRREIMNQSDELKKNRK